MEADLTFGKTFLFQNEDRQVARLQENWQPVFQLSNNAQAIQIEKNWYLSAFSI